ncbi:MAG TPA: cytochrome c3 family protein, partial [Phycisphaerae bacterium]|nr:cytochrome c3 family protein [Phycisphaerae bacterium]
MANRRAVFVLTLSVAALCGAAACSETARHRVLSFFLDGVPEPGAVETPGYPAPDAGAPYDTAGPTDGRRVAPRPIFAHAPYRENKCGACHNPETGQLFQSPQEGLCRGCHPEVPGAVRFVHGPVAVQDCFFCHHYHGSPLPHLLLVEAEETCYRCHDRARVTAGAHHAAVEGRTCLECHHAHGGENRFFLKRDEP